MPSSRASCACPSGGSRRQARPGRRGPRSRSARRGAPRDRRSRRPRAWPRRCGSPIRIRTASGQGWAWKARWTRERRAGGVLGTDEDREQLVAVRIDLAAARGVELLAHELADVLEQRPVSVAEPPREACRALDVREEERDLAAGRQVRAHSPLPVHGDRGADSGAAPGGAVDRQDPVERGDAVLEAAQARAAGRVGAAGAVVRDLDDRVAVLALHTHRDVSRVRVLRRIRDRLRDDEVRGGLDDQRQALAGHVDVDGNGAAGRERLEGRGEPRVARMAGWMPRASSRSSSSAWLSSSAAPVRIVSAPSGSSRSRALASRRATERATSRCCAPSWRSRSSRRRAASPAATMRAREARSSSSWRLRCVTSSPPKRSRTRPWSSRTGRAIHSTVRRRPSS